MTSSDAVYGISIGGRLANTGPVGYKRALSLLARYSELYDHEECKLVTHPRVLADRPRVKR